MSQDRWFEDYVPGAVHDLGSVVVDEQEVIAFARQFDPQPFHLDKERAEESVFGGLIASGWHTACMAMRLIVDHYLSEVSSEGSPGIDELRWLRPVRPGDQLAISEFPKWRKYLILLSFLDNSSARPVQIGGVDVNICHSRSTAVRGRRRSSSQSPPRGPFCRTRTGPVEADGAVDAQNAPTAPWKTLCVFHELPQGLSHQVTHEKLRKAPKYRWETRIDPIKAKVRCMGRRKGAPITGTSSPSATTRCFCSLSTGTALPPRCGPAMCRAPRTGTICSYRKLTGSGLRASVWRSALTPRSRSRRSTTR